jgi:hypothetical protein
MSLDTGSDGTIYILNEVRQMNLDPRPFLVIYSRRRDDTAQELAFDSGADSFIHFHQKPEVMNLFIRNLLRIRKDT